LEIQIDEEIPDNGIITLELTLRDNKGEKKVRVDITVHAPVLEIVNCIVDDSAEGNNNSVADPGETFDLIFQASNLGSSNISGQFQIDNYGSELTVPDPNVKSGILQFGEHSYITVRVKLSESAMFGDYISLVSTLDCSPYIVSRNFTFRVGKVRESFESEGFKVFPWLNLSKVPWVINRNNSFDGNISAQSGAISHNNTTSLKIRILFSEADSLKFYYKVSSELNYDYLQFNLNGSEMLKASGETTWLKKVLPVSVGINVMEWTYKKDNSVSQGADCAWIDLIDFTASSPLRYIRRDLEVARIVNPIQKSSLGQEPVTVRLLNLGSDTLTGINLAYQVNNNIPVTQYFPVTIYPYQDSVTLTFDSRADLDRNGLYDILVYTYGNGDDYLLNDTLSITIENSELEENVSAYPNPFKERLNIIVTSNISDRVSIILTDLAGKRLMTSYHEITAGENVIEFETPKLGASMYFLSVRGTQIYKVIPVVKVRK
ncbi:MAG: T9SS type A sorting domain-containing protein, partial [Bacteroidales bacterium]|nr:T9SS type A sorting domain-containing protein [Bacteroidales bacterium]